MEEYNEDIEKRRIQNEQFLLNKELKNHRISKWRTLLYLILIIITIIIFLISILI